MFSTETWKETEMPTKHRLYLIAKARDEEVVWAMMSSLWWEREEIIGCWAEPAEKGLGIQWSIFPSTHNDLQSYWSWQDIQVSIQGQNLPVYSEFGLSSGTDCEQFCRLHRISRYFSSVTGSKNWVLWISLTEQKHDLLLFWICLVWVSFRYE